MSSEHVTWLAGDDAWQHAIAKAIGDSPASGPGRDDGPGHGPIHVVRGRPGPNLGRASTTLVHQGRHRSICRLDLPAMADGSPDASPASGPVAVKIHHLDPGLRRWRERLKRWLGRSPGQREWRALETLARAGIAVPTPRAWGRLASGDEIVVSDFLARDRLVDDGLLNASEAAKAWPGGAAMGPAHASAIADAIDGLHRAGFRHGDLHLGNLHPTAGAIVLLDVHRARPLRGPDDRLEDLARLELSLSRAGWPSDARIALRTRLEVGSEFDPILRRFLRDHLRGRARRVLRPGRHFRRVRIDRARGLREAPFDAAELATILAVAETASQSTDSLKISPVQDASKRIRANRPALVRRQGRVRLMEIEAGDRSVIVKRFEVSGLRGILAERLRGGPAARAFHRGQAHALLSNHAARPLAYLEEKRVGLTLRSWLVMEKVGLCDLDDHQPPSPELARRIALRLGDWLADLHCWGLSHRDMKGSNLRLELAGDAIRFWLIDLEDLSSGPAELSQADRLHALSQLNASLSDEAFDLEVRREALARYCARFPFAAETSEIESEILRQSLARDHRWRAEGCVSRDGSEPSGRSAASRTSAAPPERGKLERIRPDRR
jgi:tRNA A-37 threonylcarbamoyl transferase component Bud32